MAGADISEMKDMNEKQAYEFSGLGHRVFGLLESMPKPVIAAINGYALGAAVSWPWPATCALPDAPGWDSRKSVWE